MISCSKINIYIYIYMICFLIYILQKVMIKNVPNIYSQDSVSDV